MEHIVWSMVTTDRDCALIGPGGVSQRQPDRQVATAVIVTATPEMLR